MMAATPIDEEFRTGWRVIQRLGARVVLSGGAILLGAGAIDLSHAAEPWQLYPCNLVMGLGGSEFHSDLDNLGTLVRPPPRPRAQPRADRGKRRGVRRRTHTVDSESAPRLGRRRAQGRAEPVGGDCALDLDRHPVAGRPTAAVGGNHSRARAPAITGRNEVLQDAQFWSVAAPFALALDAPRRHVGGRRRDRPRARPGALVQIRTVVRT